MAAMHTGTITERLAFGNYRHDRGDLADGRAYEERYARAQAHGGARALTAFLGRVLLAAIFATAGVTKLLHPEATIAYMTGAGIPEPETLVWVAAAAELCGAASLVFGFLARVGAIGLALFLVPTTLYFHHFWTFSGVEAMTQQVNFFKNLSIMGGLLVLAACGPGRWSLDHALRARRYRE